MIGRQPKMPKYFRGTRPESHWRTEPSKWRKTRRERKRKESPHPLSDAEMANRPAKATREGRRRAAEADPEVTRITCRSSRSCTHRSHKSPPRGDRHLSLKQPIRIRITVSHKLSSRHRHHQLLAGFHRQVRTRRDLSRGRATSAACTATKQWTAAKSNAKIILFCKGRWPVQNSYFFFFSTKVERCIFWRFFLCFHGRHFWSVILKKFNVQKVWKNKPQKFQVGFKS